jgi:hypothetical protein
MKSKLIVMVFVFMMNLSYATEVTDRSPITFTYGSVLHNSYYEPQKFGKAEALFKKHAKEHQADEPPTYYNPYGFDSERQISFKEFSALILATTAVIAFSAYVEYRGQSSDALRGGGGEAG